MSRIGIKPISIPSSVEVSWQDHSFSVTGPKGQLSVPVHPLVLLSLQEEDGLKSVSLSVTHPKQKQERALWGTMRALLQNAVKGVSEGFSQSLEVIGVGFRANLQGTKIMFEVGFSHPVEFLLPAGVAASIEKNVVTLSGVDRQLVGETAARMRRIRPPEPYKGTGIKYTGEVIRRKAGKTGKAAG